MHFRHLRPNREPDFIINTGGEPYMLRWYLIPRNPVFNIYYHHILKSDDDRALHDHPWPSVSLMIRGELREVLADGSRRIVRAGDLVYRGSEFAHRLETVDQYGAETLFITGAKVREWGFHCPEGWKLWTEFIEEGGCGEVD